MKPKHRPVSLTALEKMAGYFTIEQSICCPFCEFEGDDVLHAISPDGKKEAYICPECGNMGIGINDDGVARQIKRYN